MDGEALPGPSRADPRRGLLASCLECRRHRHRTRAAFRSLGFVALLAVATVTNVLWKLSAPRVPPPEALVLVPRLLSGNGTDVGDACEGIPTVDDNALLLPYAAGVLYMFIAIAIVCDEFFVPALEEIASESHLDLSMDVAGATLMAAGGSAPELFTSLIGTFHESEVGFGTIVGSAVFNVLFVIGMCAMFSREVLTLTWWPLARDCAYYSMGLLVLSIFCGYTSPGEIVLWEAAVQFALYIGYVVFMKYNERIYKWIQKKSKKVGAGPPEGGEGEGDNAERKASTFRTGLLDLFAGRNPLLDKVGISMVTKISGDVGTVFKTLDKTGDGFVDINEFRQLVSMLNITFTEEDISNSWQELDDNDDGKIDIVEFTKWYIRSEARLRTELRTTFEQFDSNKSGTIDPNELKLLLAELETIVEDDEVKEIFNDTHVSGDADQMTYEEFEAWYTKSQYWRNRKGRADECAEEVDEPVSNHLKPPRGGGMIDFIRWAILFPIIFILCMTVPDVRQPGKDRWCFVAFFLSITWIGGFTYFMVMWTEVIGNTLGIPMVLMGLTLLAAGTSVPDLLSSVIVARMGEGDMAVSSSIGSNIFDITVGLPVPWLLYSLIRGRTVGIKTEGMEISILVLFFMLLTIVSIIHCSGWKMTKNLGLSMFFLYFIYLAQAIIRQLPLTPPC